MRPAFDSAKQAALFGFLLLFLLAAPWLSGKRLLPPREQAYASQGWGWGPIPWVQKQVFQETNDIDIAFMGSSRIDWAIDTPYVQQKLDERRGRKTVVRSICWAGAGFDTLYVTAKDLLEHRKVKMLVFCDESDKLYPAGSAEHWFRYGEDDSIIIGLPFKYKAYYYFAATVGMPRTMIELLTPILPEETNNPVPNYYEVNWNAPNPEKRLGAIIAQEGYRDFDRRNPFMTYQPKTSVAPSDVYLYSLATRTNFAFSNRALPVWQYHFLQQLALVAKEYGCKLVVLHIPTLAEKDAAVVSESACWPEALHTDIAIVGIPTGRLFAGLTTSEIKLLFNNSVHMNQNGMEYFTPLILPALFQLYESQSPN